MNYLKKRITKLEEFLDSSRGPESLKEMFAALERGDYSQTNLMAVVVSILSNGSSVDHLRGELPDKLVDFLTERLKEPLDADQPPEERESDNL